MTKSWSARCQVVKENKMRCSNSAWVRVDGIELCRLDFNWWLGSVKEDKIKEATIVLLPEYANERRDLDMIIKFHTTKGMPNARIN